MTEPLDTAREVEKLFLVGVQTAEIRRPDAIASLAELRRLAETTDGEVVGEFLANVRVVSAGSFFSEGIVADLTGQIAASGAGTVVLDDDVSPIQQKNLEKRWDAKVLNRSELILDIFAARARTSEGKIQVELAQYKYRLPRLRGRGTAMSKLGGGIGTRGPGEQKLEVDRRVIEKRIDLLENRILKLKRQRQTQRARRSASETPVVALVGYTNAGKSTLLNAVTGAGAVAEDKLFATLDPLARRGRLPSGRNVVFTDTVGFINRLPTQLAAAFRATLEEVQFADALLHVVDASSERRDEEIRVTEGVLKDLGAGATPKLTVWNKIDLIDEEDPGPLLEALRPPSAAVSALRGLGIDGLLAKLEKLLDEAAPLAWLRFSHSEYGELARLEAGTGVVKKVHAGEGVYALVPLDRDAAKKHAARVCEAPEEAPGE